MCSERIAALRPESHTPLLFDAGSSRRCRSRPAHAASSAGKISCSEARIIPERSSTKPASEPNFDRVAHVYRWAEYAALGRLLERTREHWLPKLAGRKQALVLGDGDGRFLAKLLAQEPALTATAVDISASMLGLLSDRCAFAGDRLRTLQTSALSVDPPPATDLIVTHFFLDCLTQTELDAIAARFAAASPPGTLWLVSDFDLPPSQLLRPLAAMYIRALYLAFRWLTGLRVTHLPAVQETLSASGFERIARHEKLHGLLYTEIWMRR